MQNFIATLFCLFISSSALAHLIYETEVKSSRETVFTEEQIKRMNPHGVEDLLRQVPGVEVIRQGGFGQTTSVFIRGARSESTLVLIDGVEVNDIMSPGGGYDFSALSTESIFRIDVLQGPQSVRFGSGALGGVINIITKEGEAGHHQLLSAETGSFNTQRAAVNSFGSKNDFYYSMGAEYLTSTGFSAASENNGNQENDGVKNQTYHAKLNWKWDFSEIITHFRRHRADTELDLMGGAGGDDPNNQSTAIQDDYGLSVKHSFLPLSLDSRFSLYQSTYTRNTSNSPDSINSTDSKDRFTGLHQKVDFDNSLKINSNSNLDFGLQWKQETGSSISIFDGVDSSIEKKTQFIYGEYLSYSHLFDSFRFKAGTRLSQSSAAGAIESFQVSVDYKFDESLVLLNYGTGFKLPSLYQLYSRYGDKDLKQEKSQTVDLSFQRKLTKNLETTLTFHRSYFTNLIDYNSTSQKYFNLSRAQTQGFDLTLKLITASSWQPEFSYSYLEAKDESTGLTLLRRSKNSFNALIHHQQEKSNTFIRYRFRGERPDTSPSTFTRVSAEAYEVIDVGSEYQFRPSFKIRARIENLLDRQYEEVLGYSSSRRAFYFGASWLF